MSSFSEHREFVGEDESHISAPRQRIINASQEFMTSLHRGAKLAGFRVAGFLGHSLSV